MIAPNLRAHRSAVAEALRDHRNEIVDELVRSLPDRASPTLGDVVTGQRIVTIAAECHDAGAYERLAELLQQLAADAATAQLAHRSMQVAVGVLRARGAIDERDGEDLETIGARSMAVVASESVVPHAAEAIDDVDVAIGRLVARLDAHDPLTSEHSRAVGSWCMRLARRLSLDEKTTRFLGRCGLVHDIGKARVPLAILAAPRRLDEREWGVMRAHVTAGESIVKREDVLREHLPAIRSHHERIDGSGYPDALRGESIPLPARIVAVADAFNAMIGRRPYRPPIPPSRALEELDRMRSSHFDSDIVDAMIVVVTGS
ncbi:MAG: HD domain-containing protein [Candidatus Eremiobacteraeota bacterium]|nr:HD domain-containing protein [Candidatus Eremiobacteraeota bacterium]